MELNQNVKLNDVCQVQLGYQFRGSFEQDPSGNYSVIQMKDINNYTLNLSELYKVNLENVKPEYLITRDTVLFMPRGFNNHAVHIEEELHNTIATDLFYIIKVKDTRLNAGYLAWYLNQKPAQKYFASIREGTSILLVKIGQFKEIEIPILDLQTQNAIANLHKLSIKETKLVQAIQEKRAQLLETMLLERIYK